MASLGWRWTSMFLLLILAACGVAEGSNGPTEGVLYLRSKQGLSVMRTGAPAPSYQGKGVPSGDWSTVVRTSTDGDATDLVAVDPRTGEQLWQRNLDGKLFVKIVSADGARVVLAPRSQVHFRYGRSFTELVVVDSSLGTVRELKLKGNLEPEAFSLDGSKIFVISYLPARRPDSYQVRQLDIGSGNVSGVYTPDAHLQTAMGGTARVQIASPDGRRLYTLYTVNVGDEKYAFIHVLALDELWAHCIDLPVAFARRAEYATALAISPDGKELYVANSITGAVAEVDTQRLQVARTTEIAIRPSGHTNLLLAGSSLYFSSGLQVVPINTGSFTSGEAWESGHEVIGLQDAGNGKLFLGSQYQIEVVDGDTGETVDEVDLPEGVDEVTEFGPAFPEVDGGREFLKCAC